MALITCPECGREISNKAPACIHCGCPISVSQPKPAASNDNTKQLIDDIFGKNSQGGVNMKTVKYHAVLSGNLEGRSQQRVYVQELGRNVEFAIPNTAKVGHSVMVQFQNEALGIVQFVVESVSIASEYRQAPAASNGKSAQEIIGVINQYKPNGFMQFLASRRFYSLMAVYFGAIVYLLVEDGLYMASAGAAGMGIFFVPILIAKLLYPMHHLKKYMKKHNLEEAVRADSGYMNIAISVYNALPGKKTLAYIRSLNEAAAQKIDQQLAQQKKKS